MGKKPKGGRKQILQLEEKKKIKSTTSRVKNLIQSDSDDDSKKSNDSEISAKGTKEATPLDSEVADFFKEIDALTVNEESVGEENVLQIEEDKKKEVVVPTESKLLRKDESVTDSVSEVELELNKETYCTWQEIKDDSTGYSYYWNVKTNEVTWEVPEEYSDYKRLLSVSKLNTNVREQEENKEESLKTLQKKKTSQIKEGSIIPISYYGGSSSDESASDDSLSQTSLKSNRHAEEVVSGIIGPLLPPDFQFPQEVSSSVENSDTKFILENNSSSQNSIKESTGSDSRFDLPDNEASIKVSITYSESIQSEESPCASTSCEILQPKSKDCKDVAFSNKAKENPDSSSIGEKLIIGPRPVVDYDSCTDEEEVNNVPDILSTVVDYDSSTDDEDGVSDLSDVPNKTPDVAFIDTSAVCVRNKNSQLVNSNIGFEDGANRGNSPIEQSSDKLGMSEVLPLSELYLPMNVTVNVKRKIPDTEELHQDFHNDLATGSKKVKLSDSIENILPIFKESHAYSAQEGLGFRKENLNEDLSEKHHSPYSNGLKKYLPNKDYKSLSFIKSEHVLELSTSLLGENKTELSTKNSFDEVSSQNIVSPGSGNSDNQVKESSTCDKKCTFSNDAESKESSVSSFDYDEDSIEQIDRALCEALEAKKNAEKITISEPLASPSKETGANDSDISCEIGLSSMDRERTIEEAVTLMNKLRFIYNVYPSLTELNYLLIQSQTRISDWKCGALNEVYFLDRLQEVSRYICQYENSISNQDWACNWDSYHERYYFLNRKTGLTRETFPEYTPSVPVETKIPEPQPSEVLNNNVPTVSSSMSDILPSENFQIHISNVRDELKVSANSFCDASPPPPPPGVDTPPPPPPYSPPPYTPPPPPPDSTEDAYDLQEDMDLENSNDSIIHPIISNDPTYEVNQIKYSSMAVSSSYNIENQHLETAVDSITSTLQTSCSDSNVISDNSQIFSLSSSCSINETFALPSEVLSSKTTNEEVENYRTIATPVCLQSDNNLDVCQSSSSSIQSNLSEDKGKVTLTTSRNAAPKKEKKKTKLLSVLALKKKNIPLLVEKWQKIKEEQEKEDKSDRS